MVVLPHIVFSLLLSCRWKVCYQWGYPLYLLPLFQQALTNQMFKCNRSHNLMMDNINKKKSWSFLLQFFGNCVFLYLCISVSRLAKPKLFAYNTNAYNEQWDQLVYSALYMCHNTPALRNSLSKGTVIAYSDKLVKSKS